jgi:hypothetical protein
MTRQAVHNQATRIADGHTSMTDNHSPRFASALQDWGTPRFDQTLKNEIEAVEAACLPLSRGTGLGGRIDGSDLTVTIISARENGQTLQARAGVFFTEIVGGCSCGDEPYSQPAYCLLQVTIDRPTACVRFELIDEELHDSY